MNKYGYYNKRSKDMSLTEEQRNYALSFLIGANNPRAKSSADCWQPYDCIPKNHPSHGKHKLPPAKNEIAFRAGQRYQCAEFLSPEWKQFVNVIEDNEND